MCRLREVYHAVVISTLLYGSEKRMVKSLSIASYRLIRRLSLLLYSGDLGISRSITGQRKEWTTFRELTGWFGMAENIMTDIIRKH